MLPLHVGDRGPRGPARVPIPQPAAGRGRIRSADGSADAIDSDLRCNQEAQENAVRLRAAIATVAAMSSRRIRTRRSLGQALIETAVVIVLMMALLFTIFDFAHFYWSLLAIQNGVTQGTRFAVTNQQGGGLTRDESIRTAIKDATPGIVITDADITMFNVTDNTAGSGSFNDTIRVTVEHDFDFFTPVMQFVFDGGRIRFRASSTMKNEPAP
jgi:hypothetical protein